LISKKLFWGISATAFTALAVIACFFSEERIAFADMAYQEVYVLITGKPLYNTARPGSTILQLVPLVLSKIKLPLKTIINIHSVSFIIYHFIGFLFIALVQKRKDVAIAYLLYLVLLTSDSFYWCQSEYQQGIIFLAILSAYILNNFQGQEDTSVKFWLFCGVLTIWIFTYHPLIVIPVTFVFLYLIPLNKLRNKKTLAALFLVFMAGIAGRAALSVLSKYETGKLYLLKALFKNLSGVFTLESTHSFFGEIKYWPFIILTTLCTAFLIRQRLFYKAVLFAGFQFAYIGLILLTHPYELSYYSENMLMPSAFVTGIVFMTVVYKHYDSSKWLLVVVVLIKLVFIYDSHHIFANRKAYLEKVINENTSSEQPKAIISSKKVNQKQLMTDWATGYESILLSSLKNNSDSRVVMITDTVPMYDYFWDNDSDYLSSYSVFRYDEIPKHYFNLKKSTYKYVR
jgi:hypothetical protein